MAASDAHGVRLAAQYEQQGLRGRLGEEEEFRSMATRRMQEAEGQLRHYEDNAKQTLPTMHEELNKLRRALRNHEELNARAKSELETAGRYLTKVLNKPRACPYHRGLLSRAAPLLE